MHKVATINARIEPKLKANAEMILHKVGLTSAEAVRLFYTQICLHKGLPFEIKIPNKITQQTLKDSAKGVNVERFETVDELFDDLED